MVMFKKSENYFDSIGSIFCLVQKKKKCCSHSTSKNLMQSSCFRYPVSMSVRGVCASHQYCIDGQRHFCIYLVWNWMI